MTKVTELDKKITLNITKIRIKMKISVLDIADCLGVTESFVRNTESYKGKYNVKHIFKIKALFNRYDKTITFDDIFMCNDVYKMLIELEES